MLLTKRKLAAVETKFGKADFGKRNYALLADRLKCGVRGGTSSSEMTFIRGSNLSDVQESREDADVRSYIAIAEASYGFTVKDNWVASPMARLKWAQSQRDGYSESDDLAFSADYDGATEESLGLAIGLDQRFFINEQNALRLGVGTEFDLSYSEPDIIGTSNMPGMSSFQINLDLDRNEWRGFADVEHQLLFGPERVLSTRLYIQTPTYGSEAVLGASASLRLSF
jgi:hypothetical protein